MAKYEQVKLDATTGKARSLFTNVITPRQFQDKGDFKYDTLQLLDEASYQHLLKSIAKVVEDAWPGRGIDDPDLHLPFKTSEEAAALRVKALKKKDKTADAIKAEVSIYVPGHYTFKASSLFAPLLCYSDGQRIVTIADDDRDSFENKFYNGCILRTSVEFATYEAKTSRDTDGVTARLKKAFWCGAGQRIGGGGNTDEFSEFVGEVTLEDPTGGTAEFEDGLPF